MFNLLSKKVKLVTLVKGDPKASFLIATTPDIGQAVRVFANGSGDLGSIPGRVIPKTKKWYLMPPCLTLRIIRYGSRVNWSNPGKE